MHARSRRTHCAEVGRTTFPFLTTLNKVTVEQHSNIKIGGPLGKTTIKIMRMLRKAYSDERWKSSTFYMTCKTPIIQIDVICVTACRQTTYSQAS